MFAENRSGLYRTIDNGCLMGEPAGSFSNFYFLLLSLITFGDIIDAISNVYA
tara:strand:- start:1197 stop:1352 length:156 start_codon:yes stop_codon:yes gene_type:complete